MLIGQADHHLLTVLDERESAHPGKPSYVLTRLGLIASRGRVPVECNSKPYTSLKVNTRNCKESNYELKSQIKSLKETLREYELEDEVTQPSRNDEKARQLVERDIKVVNDRYEIPVPLNMEVVKSLPNNFDYALERTKAVRCFALKNDTLKQTLLETFRKLIDQKWFVPVDRNTTTGKVWYLPFFGTKHEKARVVYDGAATFKGKYVNQAVLAGTNLLNNLVEVLIRFRVRRYACFADLSKCFFQVAIPETQRDLFHIIWFKDNDIDVGEKQTFCFTRHVWGINSSPYIALTATKNVVNEMSLVQVR